MGENRKVVIPQQTKQAFYQMLLDLPGDQLTVLSEILDKILPRIDRWSNVADFWAPIREVETIFLRWTANFPKHYQLVLRRSLMAKLALNLPTVVEKMNLPRSISVLYRDAFERVANHLKNNRDDPYNLTDDFFLKDIRFVLGLSIPCGAQVVDMISKVPLHSVILSFFRSKNLSAIVRYARVKGYGPWFRIHTESRYLSDFDEQGWDNCYLRIAELLEHQKDVRGMVGTSWFYDPQLLEISPHLAYLQAAPFRAWGIFITAWRRTPRY